MTIDAHAHLTQSTDAGARVRELEALGFTASIQGGVGPEDWHRQLELSGRYPDFVKPVLGLHPWWVLEHSREECLEAMETLERLLTTHSEVVALGELGLDFFRDQKKDSSGVQQEVFERQLVMAHAHQLPLVLHSVHAHELTLETLQRHQKSGSGAPIRGIVHAFSGSYEVAQRYLQFGLKLSIGPGISEPGRFKQLKAALPRLAPSDWVIESDGQGQELFQAARASAGLTGESPEAVLARSSQTLAQIFLS
jgi:TatD DNase family protein